ncbi:MAG TPA: metallophosphoesterase [Clostridia bacterium]|nr:metallophosphoesterase [Clostridia bacterium]
MKILLVSDCEEPYIWDYFDRERFAGVELVLSCGDLKAEYLSFLVTMINAPLFYVPGNHNTSYIKNPPEGCVSADDDILTYNGVRILGLGGCMNYNNKEYQYTEEAMEKRIRKLRGKIRKNKGFDILLTHAPALGLGDGGDPAHTGFRCFIDMLDKYAPKYFFHGHMHLNYQKLDRIRMYKDTTIVNGYGYYLIDCNF